MLTERSSFPTHSHRRGILKWAMCIRLIPMWFLRNGLPEFHHFLHEHYIHVWAGHDVYPFKISQYCPRGRLVAILLLVNHIFPQYSKTVEDTSRSPNRLREALIFKGSPRWKPLHIMKVMLPGEGCDVIDVSLGRGRGGGWASRPNSYMCSLGQ